MKARHFYEKRGCVAVEFTDGSGNEEKTPGRALPVDVRRLADGLWRWTAPHPNAANWPDWGPPVPPEVGCVYYEAPDAVVLIDPLLPAGEEEEFLAYLDRDVERLGLPVSILLTAAWHERSAAILRERYRADDRVPESVEVYPVEGAPEEQLAYFIRPHRALVVAEVFVGDGRGGPRARPVAGAHRPRCARPLAARDRRAPGRARARLPRRARARKTARSAIELALRESAFL